MRSLVYLSPVPWASVAQRPHKFAAWFHAEHGGQVLWLDPYPARLPQWGDLRRLQSGQREPGPAVPTWLRVVRVPALPVEPLPGLAAINVALWRPVLKEVRAHVARGDCELVIGKPSRLAVQLLSALRPSLSVYDGMDDFPSFHAGLAGRSMAGSERAIVGRVDAVYASAGRLRDKFTALGRAPILVRNACDPAVLPSMADVARLREPDLIGYIGTLASWFDWNLVLRLARARPDLRFRLIGPRHVPLPDALPPNVEVLPACAHEQAMQEMARFAVGLIPFRRNALTDAVDPVKYYEYRAMGMAVISTPFGEMPAHAGEDPGAILVDDAQDATQALVRALEWQEPATQVACFRQTHAWAQRFREAQARRESASRRR